MDQTALSELVAARGAARGLLWQDPPSGLQAVLVIDDCTLGPAAGGIRTCAYPSLHHAAVDALQLARAMTLKCALAGLSAGGCKIVMREHPGLQRAAAFAELGRRIQALGGEVRTAGDFGTSSDDLQEVAEHTEFVHTDDARLAGSVGRGVLACVRACLRHRAGASTVDHQARLNDLRVAVQGCGKMGTAVALALTAAGAQVQVSDIDRARATALAQRLGAQALPPDDYWACEVDLLAPCALGGALTAERAAQLRAWAVVGAANNLLATFSVADILMQRQITLVPDIVSSSGAVVDGCGEVVMGLADRTPLIDQLGDTALEIIRRARSENTTSTAVATAIARERLARAAFTKPLDSGR